MARIIILIPVYNEHVKLPAFLQRLPNDVDLLFVDDGSVDNTWDLLNDGLRRSEECRSGHRLVLAGERDELRSQAMRATTAAVSAYLLRLPANVGKSGALRAGLQLLMDLQAGGRFVERRYVVMLDGDGQHDPHLARDMVDELEGRGLDLLVACRALGSYPFLKILGNVVLTWQARLLSGFPWQDTLCGLRVFSVDRIAEICRVMRTGGFCCEQEMCVALPLMGWKVANDFAIKVAHNRSSSTWGDAWNIFFAGLKTWLTYRCGQ